MASRRRSTQKQGWFRGLLGMWGKVALYWQIGRIIINALREYNTKSKPAPTTIRR